LGFVRNEVGLKKYAATICAYVTVMAVMADVMAAVARDEAAYWRMRGSNV
jgi:hypothetical protein